ncbi:unnamed protein product [Arctogadus glacialis]
MVGQPPGLQASTPGPLHQLAACCLLTEPTDRTRPVAERCAGLWFGCKGLINTMQMSGPPINIWHTFSRGHLRGALKTQVMFHLSCEVVL